MTDRIQLTISDIADLAGVSVGTIRAHRNRHTMPECSGYLGSCPYWLEDDIMPWLQERPYPGRPVGSLGKPKVKPSWRYQRKVAT